MEMTGPMSEHRLQEFETWGGPNEQDLVREIRRLREKLAFVMEENRQCRDALDDEVDLFDENRRLREESERLRGWVNDLQAEMYINCVYCGHRYGPDTEVPASMADVLKEHIEQCPDHPMSHLKAKLARYEEAMRKAREVVHRNTRNVGPKALRTFTGWIKIVDDLLRAALEGK